MVMMAALFAIVWNGLSEEWCGLSDKTVSLYEGWNFNSGNYLFTTDTNSHQHCVQPIASDVEVVGYL